MKQSFIKQSVINKTHKGNLNSRTHYRIYMTEQHKTIIGNRKLKLSIRDNNNGIDRNTRDFIIDSWLKAGYTLKAFNNIGITKAIQILSQM